MNFLKLFLITYTLVVISYTHVLSQISRANVWKRYRKEIIFQIGASGFLGDLGGRNFSGTDFSPADLNFKSTRSAVSAAYRYKFTKNINWYNSFNYLLLSGDDQLTQDKYRNNRNLNFKTNLFEISSRVELGITKMRHSGIYNLRKSLGKTSRRKYTELMIFAGILGFYFDPKGKNPNTDEYVKLYPLHTEGQGLPGGPKQYKKVGIAIPLGLAYHIVFDKTWAIGLEFNYRITFTDYIDDVSTTYYDKTSLKLAYGSESAIMSDPSKGNIIGATSPASDGTRAQRGDSNKDSYMSLQLTIGRLIKSKGRGRTKLRSKF